MSRAVITALVVAALAVMVNVTVSLADPLPFIIQMRCKPGEKYRAPDSIRATELSFSVMPSRLAAPS